MPASQPLHLPHDIPTLERMVAAAWGLHTAADHDPAPHDGAHDLGHLRRVWLNAQRIAAATIETVDLETLCAAAFLHDLVNYPKDSPQRALASLHSANDAVTLLREAGFPGDKLDAVHHAVHAHSFSANVAPRTLEAAILQDADRLEALGAIGLARMFYVSGAMQRALFDANDPLAQHRPLDDRAFALDHLEVKLFRIVETMNTPAARVIAGERAQFMRDYRDQLLSELR